jgi:2-phospho-L-lactate guanylyltransferase
MSNSGGRWSLLVPVKRLGHAKSRLVVAEGVRVELALAMAIDTVTAATGAACVTEVVVITDDVRAAAALGALGARVVGDTPDAGLNPALRHGATVARTSRIAAVSSDLPALRAADVEVALAAAEQHSLAVVADRSGVGTTLLAAAQVELFQPAFGHDSLAAHRAAGAVDISDAVPTRLRHDVDTIEALRDAIQLGVGEHTARILAGTAV